MCRAVITPHLVCVCAFYIIGMVTLNLGVVGICDDYARPVRFRFAELINSFAS